MFRPEKGSAVIWHNVNPAGFSDMHMLHAACPVILGKLNGRRGIEPNTGLNPFLKIAFNVFCMHKNNFYLTFFLSLPILIHCRF